MKKKLQVGFSAGIILFCLCELSVADPVPIGSVTVGFYVEIDSVSVSPYSGGIVDDPVAALAQYPTAGVGSRTFGTVTYDASNVPTLGSYIIGFADFQDTDALADEFQCWLLDWNGIGLGWMFDLGYHILPRLYFLDGMLIGIDSVYHADMIFLEDEGFLGSRYFSYGPFMYFTEHPEYGRTDNFAWFRTEGTVHFHTVPEAASLLLLACGLASLAVMGLTRLH